MANILTLESFMHVNGLQIQHSSEWEDYLEMQAQAAGMTKEEWIAYYGPSAHLTEGKKVTRKQLDKAIDGLNSAIKELTLVLPKWQEARDKGDDQAQATYLEELRELTQKKQAAEKLVNQHIKDLDKNAELKITAESLREDGIVVTEGFTSKLNQIRQRAKSAGDFIKKTLADAEFKMFNGNKKFELFLTDFYAVASESVAESEEINEKKSWALLNPEKGFVRKIAVNDYTKRPKQAAIWKDIESVTKAANEFKKHHGVDVIVHAMDESVSEATEVTKEMWDKEWNIKKAFGKDFERAYGLRVQAAMSKAKDEEQAEEWAYKNFKQLPNPAKGMTIEESFEITERNLASAEYVNKDSYNYEVGDTVGNSVDGFHFEVLRFVPGGKVEVKDLRKRRKFKADKDNFYLPHSEMKESLQLDESTTAQLTHHARRSKNFDEFLKKVKKSVEGFNDITDALKASLETLFKFANESNDVDMKHMLTLENFLREGGYRPLFMGREVIGPNYSNSPLHDKAKEMFGKKSYNQLTKKQKEEVLETFPEID